MSADVVTTVLAAAATYDLTDLPTAKDELAITDTADDTRLGRYISQVSKAVINDCNRVFAPELVQDVFDLSRPGYRVRGGRSALQLSRWPVLAVTSVVQNNAATPTTLVLNTDFRVDAADGLLLRLSADTGRVIDWEPFPTTVIYTAGFGAVVTEAHTIPGAPYAVTVGQADVFSCDQAVSYANGAAFTRVAANPAQGQYSVAAGAYTFNAADSGQASVAFTYCTLDVPDDVADAVLRLITARYRAKGRDPALIQRDQPGMGTERYWFGGAPGQTGPFPPDVETLLDNYRMPVSA
jgi:hypothetical protein